jgi:hypothetical protein
MEQDVTNYNQVLRFQSTVQSVRQISLQFVCTNVSPSLHNIFVKIYHYSYMCLIYKTGIKYKIQIVLIMCMYSKQISIQCVVNQIQGEKLIMQDGIGQTKKSAPI